MHRPGVELATFRSRVRRPNHYTTEAVEPFYAVVWGYNSVLADYALTKEGDVNCLVLGMIQIK